MTAEQKLNALGNEIADMMTEYNALKHKLVETIDKHGVDMGDVIMTPDLYGHIFDEAEDFLLKIRTKIFDAHSFCVEEELIVPHVIYIALQRLAEHQAFFDHLKHDCPSLH